MPSDRDIQTALQDVERIAKANCGRKLWWQPSIPKVIDSAKERIKTAQNEFNVRSFGVEARALKDFRAPSPRILL